MKYLGRASSMGHAYLHELLEFFPSPLLGFICQIMTKDCKVHVIASIANYKFDNYYNAKDFKFPVQ